jgi:hypothetical protein
LFFVLAFHSGTLRLILVVSMDVLETFNALLWTSRKAATKVTFRVGRRLRGGRLP